MDPTNYWAGIIDPSTLVSPTYGTDMYRDQQARTLQASLASNQIQQQLQQQQLKKAALNEALTNPSPQAYRNFLLVAPEAHDATKAAMGSLDTETQRSHLQDLSSLYGYLSGDKPDVDSADKLIQQHIDAGQRAGQDTANYTAMQQTLKSDPKRVQGLVGLLLAGAAGPDKFGEAFGQIGAEGRAQAAEPGKEALTAAQAAEANANAQAKLNPPPKTASAGLGPDGQPIFYNENAPPPTGTGAAGAGANNGAVNGFVQQLMADENGTGDPSAKNPRSSATGNGQFINKTWLDTVKAARPDLAQGKSDSEILAMRSDPGLSSQITGAYAQQNAATLGSAGLPVNGATLAMAHKLGPGGAQAVLQASPDAKLSSVLPADVIKANPQLANQTAGQYGQALAAKFGTTAIDAAPGDPNASGDDFLKTLPPARARMVKAIANGDLAIPPAVGRNAVQSQLLLGQVLQYDPSATAINLPVRKATQEAFTKGAQGQTINSLNTFAGHADKLNDAISQLDNTPIGIWNAPAQAVGQAIGNAKTQKAVANFNTWKGLASNEIVKVLRGTAGAEGDIKYWQSQLDSAKSPVALHQVVQTMAQAVQSRLESLQNEYNTGMATLGKPVPQVMPSTRAILDRLAGTQTQTAQSGAAPVATNAQGQRVVYDAASRQWKPG